MEDFIFLCSVLKRRPSTKPDRQKKDDKKMKKRRKKKATVLLLYVGKGRYNKGKTLPMLLQNFI